MLRNLVWLWPFRGLYHVSAAPLALPLKCGVKVRQEDMHGVSLPIYWVSSKVSHISGLKLGAAVEECATSIEVTDNKEWVSDR